MSEEFAHMFREITDEEVEAYWQNGWVKLPKLIPSEAAAYLQDRAKLLREEIEDNPALQADDKGERHLSLPGYYALITTGLFVVRNLAIPPFGEVATNPGLGKAAHRLIGRSRLGNDRIGTKLLDAALLCKPPEREFGSSSTYVHQDDADNLGLDRVGMVQFWIALDHVVPEQGTLTFFNGSHRLGCMGGHRKTLLEEYPAIPKLYPETAPMSYEPGDATAHHQHTIHGAGSNLTDQARWAFTATFMAEDCVIKPDADTPMGRHEPYERFPTVYSGQEYLA